MIPATHSEIEQIYISAELAGSRTLCVTACQSGQGTTSLAMALAERYLLAGYRTLYVDLNLHNPSFSPLVLGGNSMENWIEHTPSMRCFNGLPAPRVSDNLLSYKDPSNLKAKVAEWQGEYQRIVIDTSPILNINRGNIPAQVVASACDHTVLSVLSSVTGRHEVKQAADMLTDSGATLLGTVLNSCLQPTLTSELCREIERLIFLPQSWRNKLKNRVKQNRFLSIPI